MNTVYVFYNGDGLVLPKGGRWNEYERPDEGKLAMICADSWARHGWVVRRLTVPRGNYHWPERSPLRTSVYPYNSFLPVLHDIAEGSEEQTVCWTTTDVINHGLAPHSFDPELSRALGGQVGQASWDVCNFAGKGAFTLAAGAVSLRGIRAMLNALKHWNDQGQGMGPDWLACDEEMLRRCGMGFPGQITFRWWDCEPKQIGVPFSRAPLWHYSRSTLSHLHTHFAPEEGYKPPPLFPGEGT